MPMSTDLEEFDRPKQSGPPNGSPDGMSLASKLTALSRVCGRRGGTTPP